MRLEAAERRFRLPEPLRFAWGTLSERTVLEVRLTGDDGVTGRGEAAPLPGYDPVEWPAVRAALDAYAAVLAAGGSPEDCRAERNVPWALAGVDLALWDLRGRRAGRPVAALLAPAPAAAVPVNALGLPLPEGTGIRCVKVKVGVGDDVRHVAAVRALVGPDVAIRLDANGAWRTPDEALRWLEALAPSGIELCEEPVHGARPLAAVRERSPVPIACDETPFEPGSADLACLKIGRCGGISGLLAEAERVRAAGAEVYLAHAFDGPLGIAAGLHAAAALGVSRPCGLLAPWAPGTVRGGALPVPGGPGLL